MGGNQIEVFQDTSISSGGYAVISISNISESPSDVRMQIQNNQGKYLGENSRWGTTPTLIQPNEFRKIENLLELFIGPEIVNKIIRDEPITIEVPALNIRKTIFWPNLRPGQAGGIIKPIAPLIGSSLPPERPQEVSNNQTGSKDEDKVVNAPKLPKTETQKTTLTQEYDVKEELNSKVNAQEIYEEKRETAPKNKILGTDNIAAETTKTMPVFFDNKPPDIQKRSRRGFLGFIIGGIISGSLVAGVFMSLTAHDINSIRNNVNSVLKSLSFPLFPAQTEQETRLIPSEVLDEQARENEKLRNNIRRRENTIAQLKQKNRELENTIQNLKENDINSNQNGINQRRKISSLENQVSNIREKIRKKNQIIQSKDRDIAGLKSQTNREIADLNSQNDSLETKVQLQKREIDDLKNDIKKLKDRLSAPRVQRPQSQRPNRDPSQRTAHRINKAINEIPELRGMTFSQKNILRQRLLNGQRIQKAIEAASNGNIYNPGITTEMCKKLGECN